MRKQLLKTMLVGVMTLAASSAWAQTWEFVGNTAVWAADGVTLNGGAQYDANANAVTSGGVTFTGTSGFVSTAKGIGFNATGSATDENISVVVPVGYKAQVSVYTSSNRTVKGDFGETSQTFNAAWASTTKEFSNVEGTEDVTLYLYCNLNPGGAEQNKAPFLEKIVLMDMTSVSSYPWEASAVATIGGEKTVLKTWASESDVAEGDLYTVVVDKAIEKDGAIYVLDDEQFAADVFGKTFTMGGAAAVHEFNYVLAEDAVFFGEVENIISANGSSLQSITGSTVLSNGAGRSIMKTDSYITLTFTVPETAVYSLALGMNNTNDKGRGFNYVIDGAEDVSETITVNAGAAFVQEITDVTLTTGKHTLTMNCTYSLTPVFDYLLVTKTGEADAVTLLKEQLAKAIELAKLFDADTTAGEALLANPDATAEQLTAALQGLVDVAKPKAEEMLTLAKAFFAKFDKDAGEALAPYFTAAETALAGTDFEAMYDAAMALFAQGLVEGQSAMTKVNSYLEKMGNETIDADLATLNAAIASNNMQDIVAALRQLKDDMPDAALAYANEVNNLITEGQAAGNDVSAMQTAYNNALTTGVQYKLGSASVIDVGYALYELIKAVEAYKTTTGISLVTADTQNTVIYNMRGEKVMKAQKGLYIINGKKMIVK